jgi:two-component system, sensor histidine kinase PdtaS
LFEEAVMGLSSAIMDLAPAEARLNRSLWKAHAATKAELTAALAREQVLLAGQADLLRRQELLRQEFEHRLVNGLQLVVSLLSLQSRTAGTLEAAAQLMLAANRVAAIARVHRRLHLLDHQDSVEFKPYMSGLCDDLASLLNQQDIGRAILVTGPEITLPTELAIPLGFIVNELVTNSAKHGNGDITIGLATSATTHVISVADEGPGLPDGFDPLRSKGLGMTIVQSLLRQIGGVLRFEAGAASSGTRFSVEFSTSAA